MKTWEVTTTIKRGSETSESFIFNVNAITKNDAFIVAASKLYSMFAGTDTVIERVFSITEVVENE